MNAIAPTRLVTFQAERIFAQANAADDAEIRATIECVKVNETRQGIVYVFTDHSTLTVKGIAMRWNAPRHTE